MTSHSITKLLHSLTIIGSLAAVSGCNSDSNSSAAFKALQQPAPAPEWVQGQYLPAGTYANHCDAPMTGINPLSGRDFNHIRGTAMHEKMWLRSMSNEFYLWYDQLPDPDPQRFTVGAYFDLLKTDFDRFHYATPVEQFASTFQGVQLDYGIRWHAQTEPHFALRIADLDQGNPQVAPLKRGDTLIAVDGVRLSENNTGEEVDIINDGLAPTDGSSTHVLAFTDVDTGENKDVVLSARSFQHNPLPRHLTFTHHDDLFGYLQFDDHTGPAETRLISAVEEMRAEAVDELILDLRYNTGGYLYIASQLSYMIAGAAATEDMPFISPRFNDKHTEFDPIDGLPIEAMPFYQHGLSDNVDGSLPSLDLNRVYVITSGDTCSASEAIINGLRGVGVEVVQIGNSTCGKPYTFYPMENCGVAYSTVLFSNENAQGFGDYVDGFSPTDGTVSQSASRLPGCGGDDDVEHALGSREERLLATALHWHEHGSCPATADVALHTQSRWQGSSLLWSSAVAKPAWKNNGYWLPQVAQ